MKLHKKFNKYGFSLRSRQGVYTIYKDGKVILQNVPEKQMMELSRHIK